MLKNQVYLEFVMGNHRILTGKTLGQLAESGEAVGAVFWVRGRRKPDNMPYNPYVVLEITRNGIEALGAMLPDAAHIANIDPKKYVIYKHLRGVGCFGRTYKTPLKNRENDVCLRRYEGNLPKA